MDRAQASIQPTAGKQEKMASTLAYHYSIKKDDAIAVTPQLFRPIKFESSSPTPVTPEGIEPSGSKSTMENDSDNGSDSALDSAYSSDNPQPLLSEDGQLTHQITAVLQNKNLWKDFKKIGNEMIVTKPGRRLFPASLVNLSGLDPNMDYSIYLKVMTADNQRYRYINMKWCATGESEVIQSEEKQTFRHPSSPNSGSFWMKRPISFKSIKITHYAKSQHGNILLHTMHKYMLKIVVEPTNGSGLTVIPLPESTFIAVSAYQNVAVTQLKIDRNPFAKGFRYKVRGSDGGDTPRTISSCSNVSNHGGSNAIGSHDGTIGNHGGGIGNHGVSIGNHSGNIGTGSLGSGIGNHGGTIGNHGGGIGIGSIINGNPSNGNTSNVVIITSSASALPPPPTPPAIPRDTPMLTYWQQLHMQQGLLPQYNPGIMNMQPSTPSAADSKEPPGNTPNGYNCPTHIATMPNGITPHYGLFYNPYLPAPPPYIVPTAQISEPEETKEAIAQVETE